MRKLIAFIGSAAPLIVSFTVGGTRTAAQTSLGPVQQSSQLSLPASSFPSDYTGDAGQPWPVSHADGSTFSKMHVLSYSALGLQGAWYQYYAKIIFVSSGGMTIAAPIEVVYLGTYYPDTSSAIRAYSDVLSNPALATPTTCSYGEHCMTYAIDLPFNGLTYSGLARIVQVGNAVAEIRVDIPKIVAGQVSTATFNANLDGVSQAFVQAVGSLMPSSTPSSTLTSTLIPATATSTSTPIPPTATPTSTPTATPTNTPIPLFVTVRLGHKTVKVGTKQSVFVATLPLATVSVAITFPDGARKRHSGIAHENGMYTWSYKQPSIHGATSKRAAQVTVMVSNGTAASMKSTKTYAVQST